MLEKHYDAVVIGGGLSGMTSAILLAQRGKKTALIEAGRTLSPVVSGFNRGASHFETGFHYASNLGEGDFGGYIFKKLGLDLEPFPLLQDGYDEIHLLPSKQIFKMVCGSGRLEERLKSAFPEEAEGIKAYLSKVEETVSKSAFLNMHKENKGDFKVAVDVPPAMKTVIDETFKSPELKAILSVSAFLHGTPPSKISFGQQCCVAGGLYNNAYGIKGGGLAVVKAYEAALKKAGVDVFLNTKAVKLEEREDKKIITCAGGEVFSCGVCVSAIHPGELFKIAPENIYRDSYKKRVLALEETPGFFAMFGTMKGGVKFDKSNMFVVSELDIEKIFDFTSSAPSYYINFSHTDPQTVSIISLVPPDGKEWDRLSPAYADKKKKYFEKIKNHVAGHFPEIGNNIEYRAVSTPATTYTYAGCYGGYGMMHDVNKTKILPMTKIKGLYLTGQSVIAPGMLGTIITSLLTDKIIEGSL
ncbi:all-trans-retinol 13 [Parelusimicrobium proximum]|uniref:phytoene desaturase family protein n=1 Tax=Parelusimicrobium proximum TaxID=3228953 RepID=UPI003D166D7A